MKKYCRRCNRTKSITLFAHNGWCRKCMNEYRKDIRTMYRGYVRVEFDKSILTDAEMDKEVKNYHPPDSGGLNSLSEFNKQFERVARSIKSFEQKDNRNKSIKKVIGFKKNFNY